MKKNVVFFLLVLFSTFTFAQKVIENPDYGYSTLPGEIVRIDLSDSETVLHFHIKYRPNGKISVPKKTFIKDINGDDKLFVVKAEGIAINKGQIIPDSGEIFYKLYFPRLNKNVKAIDFGEANKGGSWAVYGIPLTSSTTVSVPDKITQWMNLELSKTGKQPIQNYNVDTFFNKKAGRLIGYLKNYSPRFGFTSGIIYTGNDITNEDYPVVVPIDEDGRFEVEVPLLAPRFTYMVFNGKIIKFYLEPEQTLGIVIGKNVDYHGALAKLNEDIIGLELKEFNYNEFQDDVKKLSPAEFKEKQLLTYKEESSRLQSYLEGNDISQKAEVLLKNKNKLNHAIRLFDFVSRRGYEARTDSTNAVLKIPVLNDYYDFLHDIDFNDQSLFVLNEFSTFINRFEFSKPILVYPKRSSNSLKPKKTLLEYFEEAKINISENDKTLMEYQKNKVYKSYDEYQESLKQFSEAYRDGLKAYQKLYIEPLTKAMSQEISMEKWRLRDSVVANTFKLEKNLVYDIVKIRALDFDIKRSNSENAHKYWQTLKKEIAHPFLHEEGAKVVNKKFPVTSKIDKDGNIYTLENLQATAVKLPEGRATNVFNKIMEPFKGKIVFVDFWATSCAPCVGSIERMKETRKKYEGNKDFDFVFITDERSSPEGKYNKFVEEQELKNIHRLSLDDYNYLRQLFKFNGIPRYVVIDKNGDVINDDFPMYNFNYELDKILARNK